jgi:hypothetical protein
MKKVLITLIITLTSFLAKSQTCIDTIAFDNMETFNWSGDWWRTPPNTTTTNTGFFNNASVSPNLSAVIFGAGNGTSGVEQDWYVMPNIIGLNPTSTHRFSFRLASYVFSSPAATTRGVDNTDFVEVQLSTNGGVTYFGEIRIRGFSNAFWDYNTLGVASKTANGLATFYTPTAGGNRTTTGDGFSVVQLTIPPGATQIAVDILCRVNSAGEEWWIDNVLLEEIYDCTIFPLELLYFNTEYRKSNKDVYLFWNVILDEYIDGFVIEKSLDGIEFDSIGFVNVTNSDQSFFDFNDKTPTSNGYTYYRLKWVEGGHTSYSNISAVEIKNDNNFSFTPSNNELVIQKHIIDNSIYSIKIIDNIGKQIFSKNNIKSNLEKIDITDLPSGVYVISIETEQEIKTHRFIKK